MSLSNKSACGLAPRPVFDSKEKPSVTTEASFEVFGGDNVAYVSKDDIFYKVYKMFDTFNEWKLTGNIAAGPPAAPAVPLEK